MASETVSVIYNNGISYIEIPDGFDPDNIYLLMNGQVWAGDILQIDGSTISIDGVDLSEELIQVSDLSSSSATTDPVVTSALGDIISILSGQQNTTATDGESNTTTIQVETVEPAVTTVNIKFLQCKGMDSTTGKSISGIEHLRQSLRNIIMTPRWQRVMRREYGNDIHEKVDYPSRKSKVLLIYAQLADALETWEPRFELQKISTSISDEQGGFAFTFEGDYLGEYINSGAIVL